MILAKNYENAFKFVKVTHCRLIFSAHGVETQY